MRLFHHAGLEDAIHQALVVERGVDQGSVAEDRFLEFAVEHRRAGRPHVFDVEGDGVAQGLGEERVRLGQGGRLRLPAPVFPV